MVIIWAKTNCTLWWVIYQDGEIGVIGSGGCSLDMSRMESAQHQEDILLSPAPYPHWTVRECLQQPEAIARALAFGGQLLLMFFYSTMAALYRVLSLSLFVSFFFRRMFLLRFKTWLFGSAHV